MNRPQGIITTTPGEGPALAAPLHTSHTWTTDSRQPYLRKKQKTKLNRRWRLKIIALSTSFILHALTQIFIFLYELFLALIFAVFVFAIVYCKCVRITPYTVLYSWFVQVSCIAFQTCICILPFQTTVCTCLTHLQWRASNYITVDVFAFILRNFSFRRVTVFRV